MPPAKSLQFLEHTLPTSGLTKRPAYDYKRKARQEQSVVAAAMTLQVDAAAMTLQVAAAAMALQVGGGDRANEKLIRPMTSQKLTD